MNLKQLDKFHKTKLGYSFFGLLELALSYLFVSLAINSGSLWQWALTVILLLGVAENLIGLLGLLLHGKCKAN